MTTSSSSSYSAKVLTVLAAVLGIGLLLAALTFLFGPRHLDLAHTVNVEKDAPLRVEFPVLMDHPSAEENFSIAPHVEGALSWEGETLVLTHTQPLEAGQTYTVIVGKAAKTSDQTPVGHDIVFRFVVSGPPSITARFPSPGSKDIASKNTVTVVFDRPMVPLTQIQGAPENIAHPPVTLDPATPGSWMWLSTYALQFVPKTELIPATHYTVTLPPGVPSVDGGTTTGSTIWSFETVRTTVTGSDPADASERVNPKGPITVRFNQDVDPAVAKNSLSVIALTDPEMETAKNDTAAVAAYGTRPDATVISKVAQGMTADKKPDPKSIVVSFATPLEKGKAYALQIKPGLTGKGGNLPTEKEQSVRFRTAGPLGIESESFQYGTVYFTFTTPVDEKSLEGMFTVSPAISNWKDKVVSIDSWGDSRTVTINSAFLPGTAYTVTIDGKLKDTLGQTLGAPHPFTFTVPDLDPVVSIDSKGEFGLFESAFPPVYTIKSVNVSRLNVQFNELTLDQFLDFRRAHENGTWSPRNYGVPVANLTFTPKASGKNQWNTLPIDINKELKKKLGPGIYSMIVTAPEYKDYNGQPYESPQIFMLSSTALTMKFSNNSALVWATDMETGAPLAGANITLFGLNKGSTVTGKTDKNGLFTAPIDLASFSTNDYAWSPEFWAKSEYKNDVAYVGSTWTSGMEPWNFGLNANFLGAPSKQYRFVADMQTDRPIYRPKDTVQFKAMVRLRDKDGKLSIPKPGSTVDVLIHDPSYTEVFRKTLTVSEFGSVVGSFPIAENAALGWYAFTMTPGALDQVDQPYGDTGGFSVREYKKPEYRVELTPEHPEVFMGDTVNVTLNGSYYFGAPLSNAPVTWRAQLTDYYFNKYQDEWFAFGDQDNWCWENCNAETKLLTEGKGTLNAAGSMKISVPATLEGKKTSQILTVEADVTDPNNQSVSNRVAVPVHMSDTYVGIKTDDYGVSPGEKSNVKVITVDTDGKPKPGQHVSIKIYSRTWNTIKKQGVDGEFYYDNEAEDTFITETSGTTGDDGKATVPVTFTKGGENHIVAEVADGKGRTAKAGTSMYVWSDTYVNWPHENNNRIDVVADKPSYQVGDTAKLLVKTPFQGEGVKALVTIEREKVMRTDILDVKSSALPIEVKIGEGDIPDIFVSVIIEKPRMGETFDEEGKDTGVPAYRIGYVHLKVNNEPKNLNVSIKTDKEQYQPKDTVQTTITVKDAAGNPVRGEFSLAVVDDSVLALLGYTRPNPVQSFWYDQGVGTMTAHALTYLIDRYKIGSKGGGGSGPDREGRENFVDTAYWNGKVVTDANGAAQVSFPLPDNLTTWKLIAVGGTTDNKFGATDKDIVSTKNVIVRQVHPRFSVAGDTPTLSALVHNFLPGSRTFTVTLSGKGFTAKGPATQNVTVPAGGESKVSFPVTVTAGTQMEIHMTADTYDGKDDVTERIPVYVYSTPQTVATTGNTDSTVTEQVAIPSSSDASSGTMNVTIASTIATYLPGGLDYVDTYPYGCAEQTASSFVPQILVMQLKKYEAFQYLKTSDMNDRLTNALQRLYRFQRNDGGFGYWEGSYRSEPVLSAYILFALKVARDSGYAVDSGVVSRAQSYLQNELRTMTSDEDIDLASRAYILYMLAESGSPDRQALQALYERKDKLPVFSRAELAMALKKTGSDAKAKEILQSVLDNARIDARGAHVEDGNTRLYSLLMQNTTRTTAETLQAMLRIDPDNVLVPQMMRYLLTSRDGTHWDTTQSTTQSILALVEYIKVKEGLSPDMKAKVNVDGKDMIEYDFTAAKALDRASGSKTIDELGRGKTVDVKIGKEGKGTLYYDVVLSTNATAAVLPPEERGLSITRTFSAADTSDIKPITTAKVGQTYKMTVTVTAPKDRNFVAIESPLPAGMELIDSSLLTNRQIQDPNAPAVTQDKPCWQWSPFDLYYSREEFRDDKLFLFAEHMPAGAYTYTAFVRATTPGTYRLRPAHVWEMYYPETFGQSAGNPFTISE